MGKPLAIDLFCGLGGWTEGLIAEGYRVVGFDVERHVYGEASYPAQLVLQDVRTIHGAQFASAALIVASPPCHEFSYMAMPWSKAKAKAEALRDGRDDPKRLTALFDACFRIQREASEAARRHIPLVVENVRGAQSWVGRAAVNFGSFYLWGDLPALMPIAAKHVKVPTMARFTSRDCGVERKVGGDWFGAGADCSPQRRAAFKSKARKEAAAQIAKIPLVLARHIAASWHPDSPGGLTDCATLSVNLRQSKLDTLSK